MQRETGRERPCQGNVELHDIAMLLQAAALQYWSTHYGWCRGVRCCGEREGKREREYER
jgi:hypothetical protein